MILTNSYMIQDIAIKRIRGLYTKCRVPEICFLKTNILASILSARPTTALPLIVIVKQNK